MKTQQVRGALLSALAGIVLAASPALALTTRQMGPGVGSMKTPYGRAEVGKPYEKAQKNSLFFDNSQGGAVREVPLTPLGPGPWSMKSPSSDWYSR